MAEGLRDALTAALSSDYRIEREIVAGGMSRLFVARDLRGKRDVVIKVLSPDVVGGLSLERFSREIRLATTLKDTNIVPVYSAGVFDGIPYYIMAHVRGESLRKRMQSSRVPTKEAIAILLDIARALAYAHRQGVIHRNIKPENVLLSYGKALVSDFGIARALTAARRSNGENSGRVPFGTPAYMAPEHAAGVEADARSDLYAWGVIAYELLSGTHPFTGTRGDQQLMDAHLHEAPVHLMLKLSNVPDPLCQLVMRCLEKDPALRPVAAQELVRVLEDETLMNAPRVRDEERAVAITSDLRPRLVGIGLTILVAVFAFATPAIIKRVQLTRERLDVTEFVVDGTPLTDIAIIPFASEARSTDYLADALTDELSHTLAAIPNTHVVGRTSASAFRDGANALDIGKALSVGSVVTGSVSGAGKRIRVHVELANGNDGVTQWRTNFDRPVSDVFGLQDEIMKRILGVIAPSMSSRATVSTSGARRGTTSSAAYDLFLHGEALLDSSVHVNMFAAIDAFRRAAAEDSGFARAHAMIAFTYMALADSAGLSPDSAYAKAWASASRAFTLDPTAAESQLAMAVALQPMLRYTEAERHFTDALRQLPGDLRARRWHARNLAALGKLPDALAEIQSVMVHDPASPQVREALISSEYAMRRFEDALTDARRLAARDSASLTARMTSAMSLVFAGRADSAARLMENVPRADARASGVRGTRLFAYAAEARWSDAARLRDDIRARRPRSDYDLLLAAVAFGDVRQALDIIEQSGTRRSNLNAHAWSLGCEPTLDALKQEPRFRTFMEARGLAVCKASTPWPIAPRPRSTDAPRAP